MSSMQLMYGFPTVISPGLVFNEILSVKVFTG
jgi:hypothetical protein